MTGAGRRRLAVAAVGLLLLAGCTTIRGVVDTERALKGAGFTDVSMDFSSDQGFDTVSVAVRPPSSETPAQDSVDQAARVVWTTFPPRFDLLRVELVGTADRAPTAYTYGELLEIVGPRPAGFDTRAVGDDVVRAGVGLLVVLAVGGLIFTAGVVLAIVFGVRASRRRASATPPPWPPVPGA